MGHRFLEHTADLAMEVTAPTLEDLFAEALVGLTDCVTEVARVAGRESRSLEAAATDRELLLVEWLSQALYFFDTEELLFARSRPAIQETGEGLRVAGPAWGERYDRARHPWKVALKGVTYHGLEIEHRPDGWRARVVFDI